MELTANTSKLTTSSNNNIWSSVFSENGFFVLLEIKGDDKSPAPPKGKEIMDNILTGFTNFKERNYANIKKLLDNIGDNHNISTVMVGILSEDKLYLGGKGGGIVMMQRDGKIGRIFTGNDTSEGILKENDFLLFYSQKFESAINIEKRHNLLFLNNPEEVIENIAPQIIDNPEVKGVGLLAVRLLVKQETKTGGDITSEIKIDNKQKIFSYFQKIRGIFNNGTENIYEDNEEIKSKKTLLTIAIILIFLLIGSIFLNINHSQNNSKQKKMVEVLSLVSHQYDEAVGLIDLNPIRSRELLTSSKLSLTPLLGEFPKASKEYKEISDWLGKISSEETVAYKIYKLTGVPLFFDFNLIKLGAQVQSFATYKENKVFLDTKNQVVYKLMTPSKKAEIIAGPDMVKDARTIDIHGNSIYLINSDGVVEINISSKTSKIVIKADEKWGDIVSLATYGGNIYLLDKKNSFIWKYISTDYGFSPRQSYLNSDVRVDLTQSVRMVIDGSVWVLQPDGVTKFTRGLMEQFAFKGFSDNLQNAVSFSTVEGETYLYILDKTLSRIVVFDKDGSYYAQYQWDALGSATDILASEEEKKIYVNSGSKLYAIDIK